TTLFGPEGMDAQISGQVPELPPVPERIGNHEIQGRPLTLAVAAAMEAMEQSGVEGVDVPPARRAVLVAGGFDDLMLDMMARAADSLTPAGEADFDAVEPESLFGPLLQAEYMTEMPRYSQVEIMQVLAQELNARQALTVSTACAGGSTAIGDALGLLRRGEADLALCVGVDTLVSREMMGGFCKLTALSTRNEEPHRASRPFDRDRDGFVMGEGAAALLIEREDLALARGAKPLAELAGFGYSADAYRLTAPQPEGVGMALAMQRAVEDAGMTVDEVDYINAHGTSTAANDKAETKALRDVLGDRLDSVAVSGTKSVIGHLIHGAGAVGAVVATKTVMEQEVHPTANYETPDPDCDLDVVTGEPRSMKVDGVLVNAFGFGGQNATLSVRRYVEV
ncbi:MAG: beta-ketoacyl-[acyl-carrier-protein] synthase family protein, partial [Myxococcota bacterium]|nr:beta-ketoacyl-[acyl-carrier-protein] synthase family protein [Myxococcota bacterium]